MTTEGPGRQLVLAQVLLEQGDVGAAATHLAGLLAAEPDHVAALLAMARAQLVLRQPGKALAVAEHAVEVVPASGYALHVLSAVLTALGRHPEAVETAGRAVALEPHNPDRQDRLAWALMGSGGSALSAAEQAAGAAVALAPDTAGYRITFGEVALRSGDKDRARRAFRDALALEPDNAEALHALGVLDVALGNEWNLRRIARGAEGLAGALRADPRQQQSRVLLEIGLRRFLNRTGVLLLLPAYLGFRLAHAGHPGGGRLLALAAVLLPGLTAGWFVLRLSRPLRTYLRLIVTSGRQRQAVTFAGLAGVLLVAAMLGPSGAVQWFLGVTALLGLLVRVATVSESNDHARAAGLDVPDYPRIWVLVLIAVAAALVGLLTLAVTLTSDFDPGYAIGAGLSLAVALWCAVTVSKRRAD